MAGISGAPRQLPAWLKARLPFTSRHLAVAGKSMHVLERGVGQTVLLLHGNPTWSYLWRKVAALLPTDRFRVVMPDLMGLGFSDQALSADAHTLANHVAWTAEALRALDLGPTIFVGQDWGGSIGLGALRAGHVPVSGLVLANTAISPPREGFRPTWFHRFARMPVVSDVVFRGLAFPQATLGMAQGDRRTLWFEPAYLAPLADPRTNVAPLAMARMVPNSLSHPSVPVLREIEAYAVGLPGPVELVWGMRDPILGRVVNHLARLFPHANVTRTGGGHFLPEEEPEAIAAAIVRVAKAAG